ncbi:CatB-related O-acetyltransferase [Magnetospirillum moscoviense]|uniref:Chloramphenicol acetyltransferase n=1 Tax=Magnetospirillum moscoviense TaxID=1437059 RepID=A0A178MA22_9PROT|nr:CatB-related O-acetyltransferase [Magnetospirillum moscoviense]OAN45366.1 hypothetical protein A6A05_04400 [Magnetospirillum moscoviense]
MTEEKRLQWIRSACDWSDFSEAPEIVYSSPDRIVYIENNVSADQHVSFFQSGSAIYFGRYSSMLGGGMISPMLTVGRHCSISQNVVLGGGRHPMEHLSTGLLPGQSTESDYYAEANQHFADNDISAFTRIGCDVWIGANAMVLRGRKVGTGAVIGGGAVVAHDVPPYAVVVGNPARIIRYRFPEAIIESLLKTRWWTLPEHVIATLPHTNVELCAELLEDIRAEWDETARPA